MDRRGIDKRSHTAAVRNSRVISSAGAASALESTPASGSPKCPDSATGDFDEGRRVLLLRARFQPGAVTCSLSRTKTDLARSAGSGQGLRLVTVLRNPGVPSWNGARAVAVHADEIDESAAVGSDLAPDAQDPSILEKTVGIGLQPLLAVVLSMPPFSSGSASCSTCASHGSTPLPIRGWKPPGDAAGVRAARDAARRPRCTCTMLSLLYNRPNLISGRPQDVVACGGIVRPPACACARPRQGASLRSAPASRG